MTRYDTKRQPRSEYATPCLTQLLQGWLMRFRWPQGTAFRRIVLDVEQQRCTRCGGALHVGAHRNRRIHTLQEPLKLCCRLKRCADSACPSRPGLLNPVAELSFALPGWL